MPPILIGLAAAALVALVLASLGRGTEPRWVRRWALFLVGFDGVWLVGYLGLVVTPGSFLASNIALARLGVERTGLFNGLAPLIALLSTAAVGTSWMTPLRALGAVTVAAGVTLGLTGGSAASVPTPRCTGEVSRLNDSNANSPE